MRKYLGSGVVVQKLDGARESSVGFGTEACVGVIIRKFLMFFGFT